jgi:hypothetical protein
MKYMPTVAHVNILTKVRSCGLGECGLEAALRSAPCLRVLDVAYNRLG